MKHVEKKSISSKEESVLCDTLAYHCQSQRQVIALTFLSQDLASLSVINCTAQRQCTCCSHVIFH